MSYCYIFKLETVKEFDKELRLKIFEYIKSIAKIEFIDYLVNTSEGKTTFICSEIDLKKSPIIFRAFAYSKGIENAFKEYETIQYKNVNILKIGIK